eukprot:5143619-Prymnesium_polylepis.1
MCTVPSVCSSVVTQHEQCRGCYTVYLSYVEKPGLSYALTFMKPPGEKRAETAFALCAASHIRRLVLRVYGTQ